MKKLLSDNVLLIMGVMFGAVAGFIYWKLVGCSSGTCPITSLWYNSAIYGAVMGGLLGSMLKKEKSKDKSEV